MSNSEDKKLRDPALKKARDNARQRKIASNNSDKAARKHAPRIKAMANRRIRRKDRHQLLHPELIEESADQINLEHNRKWQHWGSDNAALVRQQNQAERAYLDKTPVAETKGRRRAQNFRIQYWLENKKD